jgi:hypothetical protein
MDQRLLHTKFVSIRKRLHAERAQARIRREKWSASIRAQVEAREQRLRDQTEFFGEAENWIELQHRLQYLDHVESAARNAGLSAEDMAHVGEWIRRTRAICLTADPTDRRIKSIVAADVEVSN